MLAVLMLDKSFIFVKEVGILPWVCEGLISSFRCICMFWVGVFMSYPGVKGF